MLTANELLRTIRENQDHTNYWALSQSCLLAAAQTSYHEQRIEMLGLAQVYATYAVWQKLDDLRDA